MNDLNRSIKIFIDGTEASAGVKKIEDAISQLENKISSLDKSESGYARKSKTLQKELENKYKTLNTYKQKVAETDRILKTSPEQPMTNYYLSAKKSVKNSVQPYPVLNNTMQPWSKIGASLKQ